MQSKYVKLIHYERLISAQQIYSQKKEIIPIIWRSYMHNDLHFISDVAIELDELTDTK